MKAESRKEPIKKKKRKKKRGKGLRRLLLVVFLVVFLAHYGEITYEKVSEWLGLEKSSISSELLEEESSLAALGAQGELVVCYLDVGQGSATLLYQSGHWMLIDGGDRDYSSFVVSYLTEQQVDSLDYVMITHYDADHLNGVVGALNNFSCDLIVASQDSADTRVYQSFVSLVEEQSLTVLVPEVGDTFSFGDSTITIVGPVTYDYDDSNARSLCIRIEYGENSFLICGDATTETEADILAAGIQVKADVYLANHHGSNYSNSQDFLEAVDPEVIVISCGYGNSYYHPGGKLMYWLKETDILVYRTDLQGSIIAVSNGSTISFLQEACADYRSGSEISAEEE